MDIIGSIPDHPIYFYYTDIDCVRYIKQILNIIILHLVITHIITYLSGFSGISGISYVYRMCYSIALTKHPKRYV